MVMGSRLKALPCSLLPGLAQRQCSALPSRLESSVVLRPRPPCVPLQPGREDVAAPRDVGAELPAALQRERGVGVQVRNTAVRVRQGGAQWRGSSCLVAWELAAGWLACTSA